jgi:chromosome segregation protein
VLGEQRAKSVRGNDMLDIVFKGARGRVGAEEAEVQLELEAIDEHGKVVRNDAEFAPEVALLARGFSVGRRLRRDGQSTYLFNGDNVRLKDVRGHLLDTGLGVRAYSVLEQGKIDAVLDANPVARRSLFEEAAGISRFRLQRKETFSKLERTQVNLEKVEVHLDEMGRRIASLRRQAGRARRFAEVSEQLKELRLATGVLQLREVTRTLERDKKSLEEQERTVARFRRERVAKDEEARVLERQVARYADALEDLRRTLAGVEAEARSLEDQRAILERNLEQERQRQVDADEQARLAEVQLAERCAKAEGLDAELVRRREAELDVERELETLAARLDETRRALNAARKTLQEVEERRIEATQQRMVASNAVHGLRGQIESAEQRILRLRERLAEMVREEETLAAEVLRQERTERDCAEDLRGIREQIEALVDRRERADQERSTALQRRLELRTRLASSEARSEALEALERELEGFDPGTRALLEGTPGQAPPRGLRGALVDRLHVPTAEATAVEAALGAALTALLAEDVDAVRAATRWLREERLGRAAFVIAPRRELALEELPAPPPLPSEEADLRAEPGVLGALLDFVRVDGDEIAEVVRHLLGDAWLVEADADLAALLLRAPSGRFVTRAGEILRGGPVVQAVGGYLEEGTGIVSRRSQLEELARDQAELREHVAHVEEAIARVTAEIEAVQGTQADLSRAEASVRRALEEARSARVRAESRLMRYREELELSRRDLGDLEDDLARYEEQRAKAANLLREREEQLTSLQQEGEAIYRGVEEARELNEACQREEHRARLQMKELQGERRTAEEALAGCRRAEAESQRRISEIAQERALAERRANEVLQKLEELVQVRSRLASRKAELAEDIGSGEQELLRERSAFEGHRLRLERLQERLERMLEASQEIRLRLRDAEHKSEDLCARVRDAYSMELAEVLRERAAAGAIRDFSAEELEAAERDMKELRRELDKIGGVNMEAVDELAQIEGTYEEIKKNCDDLRQAKKRLEELVAYLDRESRSRFLETFEKVRINFQSTFRRLFSGGMAELELIGDEEDPLEKGIEIKARPPGKSLQTIGLLSGGERTMTALAILFAMFQVKPSPFCLLDEVDAALDDANVQRFCSLVGEFVKDTQFVIVTHNKHTMARCDTLYGVTMQESGVSSRVAVRWQDVSSDGRFEPPATRALPLPPPEEDGLPERVLTPAASKKRGKKASAESAAPAEAPAAGNGAVALAPSAELAAASGEEAGEAS